MVRTLLSLLLVDALVGATPMVTSLDGTWQLTTDPRNEGREAKWFDGLPPGAKPAAVPWIIQDAFPGYHGVAWYQREFTAEPLTHAGGRYLLRFWAVDYQAEVWLNGQRLGAHEGGETPFVLDATAAVRLDAPNRLTVRVLNPTNEPIDGIVLRETPARNKVVPYAAGNSYNHGGIVDSVELLAAPAVRIADLFVRCAVADGTVRARVEIDNSTPAPVTLPLALAIAPAAAGVTLATTAVQVTAAPGTSVHEVSLKLAQPHLWDLNDPYLYRVTARLADDETSVRCGFRDVRFEGGAFRLNGRRVFLRCSHTGNHCPVGQQFPVDPDWLRRDLVNVKAMGFNAIRFIAGLPTRAQLDLCDELGLMVYDEHYGSWCLAESPKFVERFDRSVAEMVRRDRNHPSVVFWGLLNETNDGTLFRHAVASLPLLRALDDSRLVLLNSGRWDNQVGSPMAGLSIWRREDGPDPNVTQNSTKRAITGLGITWQPGALALHPGAKGEYSTVRFVAPAAGTASIAAAFTSIAEHATTDVHVLHNGKPLFDGGINIDGHGPRAEWQGQVPVGDGDTIDFAVGYGNGHYGGDTTALAASIDLAGTAYNAATGFALTNPAGPWTYGTLAPGAKPDGATYAAYAQGIVIGTGNGIGSLSNPGSAVWEDLLDDTHPYQRVPHTASVIRTLRTLGGGARPMFVSEYGVGSAVDLPRVARWYEQLGKTEAEDARFYRDKLDRFLADYQRWHLDDCFARPEDFFAASHKSMAADRLYGLNALRANPNVVAHSVTGTVDQGMSGEGLFTTFRELKPGTVDALFEAWAPLRLCLFAEPVQAYRGGKVRLEAVLANEDALAPGDYPVRLQVVGPGLTRVLDKVVTATVTRDAPFAVPLWTDDVALDGPAGEYRFLATFERGGAATGGEARFQVTDAAAMPAVDTIITLWGEDAGLARWLADHGIRTRAFAAVAPARPELILVGDKAPADEVAWQDLTARVRAGSRVVFLSPAVFRRGDDAVGWLPLNPRGQLVGLPAWLYHKDEWAKPHAVFDGLPAGGLMDHLYYREIIGDQAFAGQDAPLEAIAGACNASFDYSSGLTCAAYALGQGKLVLNSLLIRENLDGHPVAERLLRNLLRWMARDLG